MGLAKWRKTKPLQVLLESSLVNALPYTNTLTYIQNALTLFLKQFINVRINNKQWYTAIVWWKKKKQIKKCLMTYSHSNQHKYKQTFQSAKQFWVLKYSFLFIPYNYMAINNMRDLKVQFMKLYYCDMDCKSINFLIQSSQTFTALVVFMTTNVAMFVL